MLNKIRGSETTDKDNSHGGTLSESKPFETPFITELNTQFIPYYSVTIPFKTKKEAEDYLETLKNVQAFPGNFQRAFIHGIVEGITTYRKEMAKLGPMYGKGLKIADKLLQAIRVQL